jgi:tRNA-2-methylthio-N6-dimethylallyladenosine synthase
MEFAATEEEIKERFDRLLKEVQNIAKETCGKDEGKTMEVLVEGLNEQDASLLTGRLSNNLLVHFPGDVSLVGSFQNVKLTEAKGFYYIGELIP